MTRNRIYREKLKSWTVNINRNDISMNKNDLR